MTINELIGKENIISFSLKYNEKFLENLINTSIKDMEKGKEIVITINKINDESVNVNIRYKLPFDNENVLKLKIINQLGKVILEQDSFDGTIDISPVAKGIYFVSITLKNKVINRKIIIQ